MKKVCPKCNTEYSEFNDKCFLKHCPNCGSKVTDSNRPHIDDRILIFYVGGIMAIVLIVLGIFMVLFITEELSYSYQDVIVGGIVGAGIAFLLLYYYSSYYQCPFCEQKFLFPQKNTPLVYTKSSSDEEDKTRVYE